jgi:hypothetical protein
MRRTLTISALIAALAIAPQAALAAKDDPPGRPLQFTSAQFQRLQQLQDQPVHAEMLNVHASYKTKREMEEDLVRFSDDFWTVATYGGAAGMVLTFLIAGAPL